MPRPAFLRPGDMLKRKAVSKPADHYGICVGHGLVVHAQATRGVVCDSLEDFTAGRLFQIVEHAPSGQESLVVARAEALIGTKYDFFGFNCEHFARYCMTGRAQSKQLQVAAVVGALGVGLWALAKAGRSDTWIDENGYARDGKGRFARK